MFKVRGPVIVDLPGLGLPHVASASFGPNEQSPLLADLLPSLPEFPAIPQQKHRFLASKNRQLELPEQVPQPTRGQAQALPEEGRGQRGRPAQSLVKQSGGFGPAAAVWLETDRHTTHLSAPDDVFERLVVRQQQQQQRQQ